MSVICIKGIPPHATMAKRKKSKHETISAGEILSATHFELISELQFKYPKFHALNQKTNNKLLENIARVIFERLKIVMTKHEKSYCCTNISRLYREKYPHFRDFKLILSTLHKIEDDAREPRSEITAQDLLPYSDYFTKIIENTPGKRMERLRIKYSNRIIECVREHVGNLNSEVVEGDDEEEVARKKVRDALKKMSPIMPMVYGEPFLPNDSTILPFLKIHHATFVTRSDRIYNMIKLNVRSIHSAAFTKLDNTNFSGVKLRIRPSSSPRSNISAELQEEIRTAFDEPVDQVEMENR